MCGIWRSLNCKVRLHSHIKFSIKEHYSCNSPAVEMEECVAYVHVSTLEHTSQGLLPATTEPAIYDYI